MTKQHGGRRGNTKRRPDDKRGGPRVPGPGKKLGRPTAMQSFIRLLTSSDYGVEIPYGHNAYTAYVKPDEGRGGYVILYCKGMMPPHANDHADTAEDAASKIAEVADLNSVRVIEED